MITGVAFVPQAPALVPEIGRGLEAELGPLRDACRTAIRRVATPGTPIVVVSDGDETAGFGVDVDVPTVGEWLVRDALGPGVEVRRVDPDALADPADEDVALVVVGDGSARRTEKAPGYLDPRAAEYDAEVASALATGYASGLLTDLLCVRWIDTAAPPESVARIPGDLMVAGSQAWEAVSSLDHRLNGSRAELLYDDAPFGVGYFVATWLRA